ncbi:MAG: TspO/MBR family protein [Gemmatimonadota bacterium]
MSGFWRLVASLGLPQAVGILSGLATARGVRGWYPGLEKPSFNPPSWVFAPVWTALYLAMGVAAWLVWRKGLDAPGVRPALLAFLVQLALNGLWSLLFFSLRSPGLALAEITVLWAAIGVTTILFFRQSGLAGWLMAAYWAWVTFAALLNFSIWRLNA